MIQTFWYLSLDEEEACRIAALCLEILQGVDLWKEVLDSHFDVAYIFIVSKIAIYYLLF